MRQPLSSPATIIQTEKAINATPIQRTDRLTRGSFQGSAFGSTPSHRWNPSPTPRLRPRALAVERTCHLIADEGLSSSTRPYASVTQAKAIMTTAAGVTFVTLLPTLF